MDAILDATNQMQKKRERSKLSHGRFFHLWFLFVFLKDGSVAEMRPHVCVHL